MIDGVSLGKGHAIAKSRAGLALHIRLDAFDEVRWIPISVLHDDSEVYDVGHTGNVVVNEWWADKEGLSDAKKKGPDAYGSSKKP